MEYDAAARRVGIDPPNEGGGLAATTYAYDSEVFAVDVQVGRVLDRLRALGIDGTTGVILTSDHGEHFGEHGLFGHLGVYEAVLKVPLVVHDPRRARAERIASVVAHVDIFPTVLALLDTVGPVLPHGRAVPPYAVVTSSSALYAEHADARTLAFALREGPWKLVAWRWPDGQDPARRELFDLDDDPAELRDRAAEDPIRVRAMSERLASQRVSPPGVPRLRVTPEPDVAEQLRSLGYIE